MTGFDIARQRLANQHISQSLFEKPAEVVARFGAVQAQDYAGGKWAVGQRTIGMTDADIDQACQDGTILRTHVMRPTWHFVTPADIRWLLELTAPRVNGFAAYYYRKLELDDAVFAHSDAVLAKALEGGRQHTRVELAAHLQKAGIATHELLRVTHLMLRAELDGVICSGARRGKQFTYALLDERAPQARTLARDDALAELAKRYFTAHGPATLKDYAWWSGLSASDAKAGLEMVKPQLNREVVDGQEYWFAESSFAAKEITPSAFLLPNFDEYTVGYADRSAAIDPARGVDQRSSQLLSHTIVIDGKVVGNWKRTFKKDTVIVAAAPFVPFSDAEALAFAAAATRYGQFLGMKVVLA